jgi:hypothetical protein
MEEASTPREPLSPRIWIPCALSSLILFGLSSCLRFWVAMFRQIKDPSFHLLVPEFFSTVGSYLWIPVLLASAWGLRLMWTRRRAAVLTWFLWTMVVLTFLHAYLIYSFHVLSLNV